MIVNLVDPAADVHLEHLVPDRHDAQVRWFSIAKVFPIRALADGLQYVFDPRTVGRRLQRAGPADACDLDGRRGVPDAAVPASSARRGRVSQAAGSESDREHSPARDRSADTIVSRLTDARLGDPPRGAVGRMRMFIWLVFIAIPLADAVSSHDDGPSKALTVLATIAFVAVFVSTAVRRDEATARPAGTSIGGHIVGDRRRAHAPWTGRAGERFSSSLWWPSQCASGRRSRSMGCCCARPCASVRCWRPMRRLGRSSGSQVRRWASAC